MSRRWLTCLAIGLLAIEHAPGQAQTAVQAPTSPAAPAQPPRVGVAAPPLSLTLADAIRMTLEQNNDVAIARMDTDIARQNVRAFQGLFDPRVTPNVAYQRIVTANTSAIGGATEGRLERTEISGGAAMTGRVPWGGGRFTVDFSSSRLDTSNQFARLNPEFPSALTASYTQPLFRGRAIDQDRRNILLARRAVDLTDAQLAQVVMDQLTLVEQAYWDLAFAVRNLDVLTSALAQARTQVESNERQAKEGTLAPIDVVEAQTQVSRFQLAAASGQQALTEAENRLKRLMLADRTAAAWNQPMVPTDLEERSAPPIGLDAAVQLALSRRPELRALESTRAQNDVDRAFFRDQTKPAVNLVGGTTLSGLAGDPLSATSEPPVGDDDPDARRTLAAADAAAVDRRRRRASVLRRRLRHVVEQPARTALSNRDRAGADGLSPAQSHRPCEPGAHRNRRDAARAAAASARAGDRERSARHAAGRAVVRAAARRRGLGPQVRIRTVRERTAALRLRPQHRVPRPRAPDHAGDRAGKRASGARRPQSSDRPAGARRRPHARLARGEAAVLTPVAARGPRDVRRNWAGLTRTVRAARIEQRETSHEPSRSSR
jgi:outer membrane protein TolC